MLFKHATWIDVKFFKTEEKAEAWAHKALKAARTPVRVIR